MIRSPGKARRNLAGAKFIGCFRWDPRQIRAFRGAADWMQFHEPTEIATALSIEAAELQKHFLGATPEQTYARRGAAGSGEGGVISR